MIKFFYLAFASLVAAASFASGDTPTEWYTPSDFDKTTQRGKFTIKNKEYEVYLGSDGKVYAIGDAPKLAPSEENAVMALEAAWVAQAQVETLADTIYGKAVTDLEKDKDGNLTWTVGGKSANGKKSYSPPKYEVGHVGNGWFRLFKDNAALAPAWFGLPGGTSGVPVQVDAKSISTNKQGQIEVAGFEDASKVDAFGFFSNKGKWYSFFTGNGVSADVDDSSIQFEIAGFKSQQACGEKLSKMLTDPGDVTQRNRHQLLARVDYPSGPSIHYLPIGDIIGVTEPDGVTITTNNTGAAANKLAIAGAYDPNNADKVLASTGSGTKWITAGGGSALAFYGWNGTSATGPIVVGSGSVTNAVRFASADDSNVKVTCESDNNGGVKITIGVYYK